MVKPSAEIFAQAGRILPERSNYFDVGAKHEFLPGLKLGVDGFYKIARI